MSEILDLIENGQMKEAMNTMKRQDRIRSDNLRLWQALLNAVWKTIDRKWLLPEEEDSVITDSIYYMEDREFLKLIFE